MKLKLYTLLAACLCTANLFATEPPVTPRPMMNKTMNPWNHPTQNTYRMKGYASHDGVETYQYYWDDKNRLVAFTTYMQRQSGEDLDRVDSFFYNDQDLLIRINSYRKVNGEYVQRNRIDYTWHPGTQNLATRTNYNFLGSEALIGGIYHYEYDEQNRLVSYLATWDNGDPINRADYKYNAEGLLQEEIWQDVDLSGNFINSAKWEYTYNEAGQNTHYSEYKWDATAGDWALDVESNFTFDERGNCIIRSRVNASGREIEKSEFEYGDQPLDQTLIPYSPEFVRPDFFGSKYAATVEHFWVQDDNGVLQYVFDYNYTYEKANGIAEPLQSLTPVVLSPNPADEYTVVSGLQPGLEVVLLSAQGTQVRTAVADAAGVCRIDLTGVAAGNYIVSAQGTTAKLVVK